jgi:hypothetical protein
MPSGVCSHALPSLDRDAKLIALCSPAGLLMPDETQNSPHGQRFPCTSSITGTFFQENSRSFSI